MPPTSTWIVSFQCTLAVVILALGVFASEPLTSAQEGGSGKKADKPLYIEYKGVRIGMDTTEVRTKLGDPADKGDVQDFFVFSEKESAQVYYIRGKVMAVSVNYVGDNSGAPLPKAVLGTDVEPKADGAMHKMVRYPAAGYWVSYNRTGGEDPLVTVTMQKIQ